MKKILTNYLFMWTNIANLLSNFGDIVYYLALMNYALILPNTANAVAIISVSEGLPIFLQYFTGLWADRTSGKLRVIQLTLLFRCLLYLILGLLMTFSPALWIVIVAATFNFFADLAGNYENSLFLPIALKIMPEDDRADYLGFSQSLHMISVVAFQSAGAILISFLSYSQLAYFNAISFLIPMGLLFLLKNSLNKLMDEAPLQPSQRDQSENKWSFQKLKKDLIEMIEEMRAIPELRICLVIAPILNGFFAVFPALLILIMNEQTEFVFYSPALTLAVFQTAFMLGGVVGGLMVMTVFKGFSIPKIVKLSVLILFLQCVFLGFKMLIPFLLSVFIAGMIGGALNPKLNAAVFNHLSEQKLGRMTGAIGTYFQLGILIIRLLFSVLIIMMTLDQMIGLLILCSALLLLYTLIKRDKGDS